jgi:hypothetical protein
LKEVEPMPKARRVSPVNQLVGLAAISLAPVAVLAAAVAPRIRTCGTTSEELTRHWPGDQLVPNPSFVWTNALTIDRPAAEVWPWVTQLGQGRGGLYSYDWLENALLADVHSVHQIQPALQGSLQVGDRVIRMTRYAPHNPVALYEPGRALVLGGVKDSEERLRAGRPPAPGRSSSTPSANSGAVWSSAPGQVLWTRACRDHFSS